VEAAVVNKFKSMKDDIGNIESTTSTLSLLDYIEKWRILLWGETFLIIMKRNPPFTKSTQLTKISEVYSIIKRVLYMLKL
jgi:hypothetical protein